MYTHTLSLYTCGCVPLFMKKAKFQFFKVTFLWKKLRCEIKCNSLQQNIVKALMITYHQLCVRYFQVIRLPDTLKLIKSKFVTKHFLSVFYYYVTSTVASERKNISFYVKFWGIVIQACNTLSFSSVASSTALPGFNYLSSHP